MRRLLALFCGMCAVAALSARDFRPSVNRPSACSPFWAARFVLRSVQLAKANLAHTVLVLAGWQMILGGIPLLILAPLFDRDPLAEFTLYGAGAVAYTVLVGNMIGFVLWIKILELIPAPIATISLLPVPMVGIMSGVLILGESVGWQEGVAVLLITTALASTLNLPSKKNVQKNRHRHHRSLEARRRNLGCHPRTTRAWREFRLLSAGRLPRRSQVQAPWSDS